MFYIFSSIFFASLLLSSNCIASNGEPKEERSQQSRIFQPTIQPPEQKRSREEEARIMANQAEDKKIIVDAYIKGIKIADEMRQAQKETEKHLANASRYIIYGNKEYKDNEVRIKGLILQTLNNINKIQGIIIDLNRSVIPSTITELEQREETVKGLSTQLDTYLSNLKDYEKQFRDLDKKVQGIK